MMQPRHKPTFSNAVADGTTGPPDRTQALKLLDGAEAAEVDVSPIRSAFLTACRQDNVSFW